jgi:hypothetical protein
VKASELKVGAIVAVTDGASKYERRTSKATQAKVVTAASSGYVGIELLEDAKTGLGNRRTWDQRGMAKKGDRVRIKTVCAWMPWETLGVRAENERAASEKKDREERESEDRLADLQRRTDQFAGDVNSVLRWGGSHYNIQEEYVRIPTTALKHLLDKAEGK